MFTFNNSKHIHLISIALDKYIIFKVDGYTCRFPFVFNKQQVQSNMFNSNKTFFSPNTLFHTKLCFFLISGVFLMMVVMVFADNAFRLQCKDFWVGGSDPNTNHLSVSWVFELIACIFSFITGAFTIWLVVLKARDEI